MDKQPIVDAVQDANDAVDLLRQAAFMEYSASFKTKIGNAACLLEFAAARLRNMEAGRY